MWYLLLFERFHPPYISVKPSFTERPAAPSPPKTTFSPQTNCPPKTNHNHHNDFRNRLEVHGTSKCRPDGVLAFGGGRIRCTNGEALQAVSVSGQTECRRLRAASSYCRPTSRFYGCWHFGWILVNGSTRRISVIVSLVSEGKNVI